MSIAMTPYYFWWAIGLVLIACELAAPGFFLLWIGLAGLLMGIVTWAVPGLSAIWQALLFVAFSFATCLFYWRTMRRPPPSGDAASRLSRRGEQLIGNTYVLETAIENGRGKARVGDSLWLVEGPDLPAGANVEVTSVHGATLVVRAA